MKSANFLYYLNTKNNMFNQRKIKMINKNFNSIILSQMDQKEILKDNYQNKDHCKYKRKQSS